VADNGRTGIILDSSTPARAAAGTAVALAFFDRSRALAEKFIATERDEPEAWQDVSALTNADLWLSVEETRGLTAALAAAIEPFRDRTLRARPEGTRRVRVMTLLSSSPEALTGRARSRGVGRASWSPALDLRRTLRDSLRDKAICSAKHRSCVPMEPTRHPPEPTPTDDEDVLDPQTAAVLLDQTSQAARRQFDARPPVMSVLSAAIVLVVYGAIWFSARGQHPYRGPSLSVVGIVYIVVAIGAAAAVGTYFRATSGVKGRSRREDRILAIPMVAALAGFYTFLGALGYDGFSHAVVYGVVDAAGPWLVVGAVLGGLGAAREDPWKLAAGVALIIAGAGAAFAGPIDVWAILALAGCVLLLAQGAVRLTSARGQ
jgi:hypothetical protein